MFSWGIERDQLHEMGMKKNPSFVRGLRKTEILEDMLF